MGEREGKSTELHFASKFANLCNRITSKCTMSIPVALQFDIYYLDLLFSTTILVSLFRQMKIRFTCNNADKGNLNNDNLVCSCYGVSS